LYTERIALGFILIVFCSAFKCQ